MANQRKRKRRGQRRKPPPQSASRRRGGGAKREAATARTFAAQRAAARDERPPAPWGSFPLVELTTLVALVLLILGFFVVDGERGSLMIVVGIVLGSLAGLELSIREHFGGYRSHSLLLSAVAGAAVLAALSYVAPDDLSVVFRLVVAGIVFAGSARVLMLLFQRRAGVAYKLR